MPQRVIFGLGSLSYLAAEKDALQEGAVVPFAHLEATLWARVLVRPDAPQRLVANCILAAACSRALKECADGWFVQRTITLPDGSMVYTQGWRGAQLRQLVRATDDPLVVYRSAPPEMLSMDNAALPDVLDIGSGEAKLYRRANSWAPQKRTVPEPLLRDIEDWPERWEEFLCKWLRQEFGSLDGVYCFATGWWRSVAKTTGKLVSIISQEEETQNEWHAVCAAVAAAQGAGLSPFPDLELCGYVGYGGGSLQGVVRHAKTGHLVTLAAEVGTRTVIGEMQTQKMTSTESLGQQSTCACGLLRKLRSIRRTWRNSWPRSHHPVSPDMSHSDPVPLFGGLQNGWRHSCTFQPRVCIRYSYLFFVATGRHLSESRAPSPTVGSRYSACSHASTMPRLFTCKNELGGTFRCWPCSLR